MARKQNEAEDAYDRRIREAKERLRESRSRNELATTNQSETPPPPVKEPWVPSPLPGWAKPLAPKPDKPISAEPLREEQMIHINLKQRVTIFVGLLLEAAMLLFPPWKVPEWASAYHLFSSPPTWTDYFNGNIPYQVAGKIDIQRLEFQCLIVAIIVIGLVVLLGGRKSKAATQE